jgi:hypothetical protein
MPADQNFESQQQQALLSEARTCIHQSFRLEPFMQDEAADISAFNCDVLSAAKGFSCYLHKHTVQALWHLSVISICRFAMPLSNVSFHGNPVVSAFSSTVGKAIELFVET